LCLNKATLDNRSVVIVLISQHYVYDSIVLTNISARNTIMYLWGARKDLSCHILNPRNKHSHHDATVSIGQPILFLRVGQSVWT